jgi:hypothetical protein
MLRLNGGQRVTEGLPVMVDQVDRLEQPTDRLAKVSDAGPTRWRSAIWLNSEGLDMAKISSGVVGLVVAVVALLYGLGWRRRRGTRSTLTRS